MGKRDRLIKITVAENRNTYVQIKEEKGSELYARIMGNATITDIDGDDMSNLLVPEIIKEMAEFVIVTNGLRTKIEVVDRLPVRHQPTNAGDPYKRVTSPEQVINLISNIVNRLRSGESNSIKAALEYFHKDRKTVDRFKWIYYLSKLNNPLLKELIAQWVPRKAGGLMGLAAKCKEKLTTEEIDQGEDEGRLLRIGPDETRPRNRNIEEEEEEEEDGLSD